ncbi:hypothetical protein KNT81_gp224 [Proteus phage phiP4-3]|uniref:Putative membrane protein n=1 Tax=Proteus phage phiP4-3 TaxID=2065203 RepID=A0A2I6PFR0_9CAUD|nr:hypothetical protein KNT81_gp224 [Proteus phage phiP4-3]AUM58547.1 putative membrane protein [Proteus phage phiP4-3]AZV01213.1 membrane protein [Shigella phage vB_SdyM_006]
MKLSELGLINIGDTIIVESMEYIVMYTGLTGIVVYGLGLLIEKERFIKFNDEIPYASRLIKKEQ